MRPSKSDLIIIIETNLITWTAGESMEKTNPAGRINNDNNICFL